MKVGEYNRRVTIQQSAQTVSATGAEVDSWSDFIPTTWAKVEPLEGREYWSGTHNVQQRVTVFHIRWRESLKTWRGGETFRIQYAGENWQIESVVDEDDKRQNLLVRCVANA